MADPQIAGADFGESPQANEWLKQLIAGLGQNLKTMVMFPGEYAKNGVMDTGSAVSWAAPQALGMVGGPGASPLQVADSTLGSFAGRSAKTAPEARLEGYADAAGRGMPPEDLWKNFGWMQGLDRRNRFEISDHAAKLNPKNVTEAGPDVYAPRNNNLFLPDVLQHPELYKAYPELGEISVGKLPIGEPGLGMFNGERIEVAPMAKDNLKSVFLHEGQHGIQSIEGFTVGGSPEAFIPKKLAPAEENFRAVRAQTEAELQQMGLDKNMITVLKNELIHQGNTGIPGPYAHLVDALREHPVFPRISNIAESERLLNNAHERAQTSYNNLAGEVEARNVQTRMNMRPTERAMLYPPTTEDVPRFLQTLVEAFR